MCEYIIVEDFNMDKHIFNEDNGLWYEPSEGSHGETDAASGGCADLLGGEAAGTVSAICPAGKGAYYAGAQAGAQA